MKNKIIKVIMLISIFIILLLAVREKNLLSVIYCILLILIIDALQLIKSILKVNYQIVTIIQLIGAVIFLRYQDIYLILLITVLIFDLLQSRKSIYINSILTIGILLIFSIKPISTEGIVYLSLTIILLNLYLAEIAIMINKDNEYMKLNKDSYNNKVSMERRIDEMEKYLEQNSIMTSLKERNFIAQKLHDHLGHRITGSLMQLEVTKEMISKNNELANKYLISAMDNLREGMDEIRVFLSGVKPRETILGIETIKDKVMKFQYVSGIETSFSCEGDVSLIKLGQLRIIEENIKEALTNAAKYSKASKINVAIFIYNKFYRVEVRDNGCGCHKINKGLGLRGIEERLQLINGRVEYYSDEGFVVNMVIKKEV